MQRNFRGKQKMGARFVDESYGYDDFPAKWPPGMVGSSPQEHDQSFLRKCKVYVQTIKKCVPHRDHLSVYCVVCCHYAKNIDDLRKHTERGQPHRQQMDKIRKMPDYIQKQVNDVIEETQKTRTAAKQLTYCDICLEDLPIPYFDHKNSANHVHKLKAVEGCVICDTGKFNNYTAFAEHCKSEDHMKKLENNQEEFEKKIESCTKEIDYPVFKDGVQYGLKHVKAVTGYYCRLCKMYTFSDEEKENHIRNIRHYYSVRNSRKTSAEKPEDLDIDMGDYVFISKKQKTAENDDATDSTNGTIQDNPETKETKEVEN